MSSPGWSLNGNQLTTSANVGIGTATPGRAVEVAAVDSNTGIKVTGNTSNRSWLMAVGVAAGDGKLAFYDYGAAAHRLTIDTNGKVGIGTSSPKSALEVQVSTPSNSTLLNMLGWSGALTLTNAIGGAGAAIAIDLNTFVNPPSNTYTPSARIVAYDDGNYGAGIYFLTRAPGAASNGMINRLQISSNGNVGIGITQDDAQRDGEPISPLVVHGNVEVMGNGNVTVSSGNVSVSGDVLLTGADCAEDFDFSGNPPEPGTVVVIDEEGSLRESRDAYDKRVAGVVSGAGDYRHALVLDKRPTDEGRAPVALVGKVYCKVDAQYSRVEVGDLLTTSATPGHAMKADEPARAFGAVIGKALRTLEEGQALIPILIGLQ